jgi:hypothetical protein
MAATAPMLCEINVSADFILGCSLMPFYQPGRHRVQTLLATERSRQVLDSYVK